VTTPTIEHDEAGRRFVAHLDAGDAYLAYERTGETALDLQHTIVPEEARGEGVGEALVRAATDYARAHGQQIIPTCPFVANWLTQHPEAQDLVAVGG
jgi:predicted GNAT family acetyltransferase